MAVEGVPAAVAKLDAEQLMAEVNARTGAGLRFAGRAAEGQVGAAFVQWPDGRDGVLTRGPGSLEELRRTADALEAARDRGLPVPRYELLAEVPAGVGVVQERLPGRPPAVVDRALLEAMIQLNERFAGLGGDLPVPSMYLLESGPGFCLHESLRRYDDRTRRLLDWVHQVGRDEPGGMRGDDLVHLDFHAGNVLIDEAGEISGIVDWDGIGRGDRRFALVTLRFNAYWRLPGQSVEWFDELLDAVVEPETLRLYWAHMSLREVDWAIRHHGAADVDRWLSFAGTRVD